MLMLGWLSHDLVEGSVPHRPVKLLLGIAYSTNWAVGLFE